MALPGWSPSPASPFAPSLISIQPLPELRPGRPGFLSVCTPLRRMIGDSSAPFSASQVIVTPACALTGRPSKSRVRPRAVTPKMAIVQIKRNRIVISVFPPTIL